MSDRISTLTLHDAVARAIAASNQRVMKLQQGLADGRAVRKSSDDPVLAHQSMMYREQIRSTGQYVRTAEDSLSLLSATETALQQMQDTLGEIRALQTTGSDDAVGIEDRRVLAQESGQLTEELLAAGNTRHAGRYIFGGRQTLSAPLAAQRDEENALQTVAYNPAGVTGAIRRALGPDLSLTINIPAVDLFGEGAELFRTLRGLEDALSAGNGEQIRSYAEKLDAAQNRVTDATTTVGSWMNRLETMQERMQQDLVSFENGRSRAEDLDVARSIVDFQTHQAALEAALAAGSRILSLNLLDFIQ